jgi:hypothetical protein
MSGSARREVKIELTRRVEAAGARAAQRPETEPIRRSEARNLLAQCSPPPSASA